jgi:hypothetical protein
MTSVETTVVPEKRPHGREGIVAKAKAYISQLPAIRRGMGNLLEIVEKCNYCLRRSGSSIDPVYLQAGMPFIYVPTVGVPCSNWMYILRFS